MTPDSIVVGVAEVAVVGTEVEVEAGDAVAVGSIMTATAVHHLLGDAHHVIRRLLLVSPTLAAGEIQILENRLGAVIRHLEDQAVVETGGLSQKDQIPEIGALQTLNIKNQLAVVGDPVVRTFRHQLVAVGARQKMSRRNLRAMVGVPLIRTTKHRLVEVGVLRIPQNQRQTVGAPIKKMKVPERALGAHLNNRLFRSPKQVGVQVNPKNKPSLPGQAGAQMNQKRRARVPDPAGVRLNNRPLLMVGAQVMPKLKKLQKN